MKIVFICICSCLYMFSLASCSSTTMINSRPQGAKLYMDEQYKGTTPYSYSDSKIVGSATPIRLELDGYATYNGTLVRSEKADVGAIIGGIFLFVPFLWTMEYDPVHTYELRTPSEIQESAPKPALTKDKAETLRELRKLYDEGTLTKEEYAKEKQKILDGK